MEIEEFENIDDYELSKEVNNLMDDLLKLFRKAEYVEAKNLIKEYVKKADKIEIQRLVRNYVDCLNFEWPNEINRLPLERYAIVELICQEYGSKICDLLDFILFENNNSDLDIRHLHSGAVHLLTILALRNVRKNETLEKINKQRDKIYYIGNRTLRIFESLNKTTPQQRV